MQLDGELVALGEDGRPDFHLLGRRTLHRRAGVAVAYFVFDVLAVEGLPATTLPYRERSDPARARAAPTGPRPRASRAAPAACYNALDRHLDRGRADQPALVYDSPVTETVATFTYRELRDAVASFAGALAAQGVTRGDRVIVYMPMVPEAVIAMLAYERLGATHSVVFGGFAATELARIDDAEPKVIVTTSCGIELGRLVEYKPLLDAAIGTAESKPQRCIVLQRPMLEAALDPDRDIEWNAALSGLFPSVPASLLDGKEGVDRLRTATQPITLPRSARVACCDDNRA